MNNGYARAEREAQKEAFGERVTRTGGSEFFFSVASVLTLPLSVFENFDNKLEYFARGTAMENDILDMSEITQTIRGEVAEDLNKRYGTLGENFGNLEGRGWGDVYRFGMGVADSAIPGSLGQVGFDLSYSTGNMVPAIAASAVFGPGAGAATMGTSAAGNAYAGAINEGYTPEQARAYATFVGISEAGMQYVLGGIGAFGGKLSNTALAKLSAKLDNAYLKVAAKYGGKLLAEGGEEWLQEALDPLYRNLALMEDNKINLLSEESLYSGMLGMISAGLINSRAAKNEVFSLFENTKENPEAAKAGSSERYERWYNNFREDFGENLPETFAEYEEKMYNDGKAQELNVIKNRIKTIDNAPFYIHKDKIIHFLLEPEKKHSKDFFDVGYTVKDSLLLKYDILKQVDEKNVVNIRPGHKEPEIKFSIFMDLGVTKKKRFRTVWQIDKPGDIPKIVTAYRED